MSRVVTRLCNLFSIRRARTSGYRPQSNSAAENFNRTIWKGLRAYCSQQEKWPEYLQPIMLAYRSTVSAFSTQYTPYHIMFGREMRLPIDNELLSQSTVGSSTADDYMRQLLPKVKLIHEAAAANVEEAQQRYKATYDKRATTTDYKPGTLMWLFTPPKTEKGKSKKMQKRYDKLVYIKSKCQGNTYIVIDSKTNFEIPNPIHSDRLKLYHSGLDMFPDRDQGDELDDSDNETNDERNPNDQESGVPQEVEVDTENIQDHQNTQPSKITPTEQTQGNQEASQSDNRAWFTADKLLGVRMKNGQRYYLVKWSDGNKPTYEKDTDVSDFLKRTFHSTRTLMGKVRKGTRHRGRNFVNN